MAASPLERGERNIIYDFPKEKEKTSRRVENFLTKFEQYFTLIWSLARSPLRFEEWSVVL
jgi:hypothetical protein